MKAYWFFLFLMLWASVATLMAVGFAGDASDARDLWLDSRSECYELRVKHEGWKWVIPGKFAMMPIPPDPYETGAQ